MRLTRHGFTGECGGVEKSFALADDAVERDALARADEDRVADLDLVREYLFFLAAAQDTCGVGTNIHERRDGAARTLYGVGLEPLADLIEQHDCDALGVVSKENSADGRDRHEEVFVKDAPMPDVDGGTPENIPADERIRGEEQCHADSGVLEDHAGNEERRRTADAIEHPLLFFRHRASPSKRLAFEYGVRFDGLDDLPDFAEDLVKTRVVSLERHTLTHEVDAHFRYAVELCYGVLNLLCAVPAVEFAQFECLFHGKFPFLHMLHMNRCSFVLIIRPAA